MSGGEEYNRRTVLKNLGVAGAVAVSPTAASGSKINPEDVYERTEEVLENNLVEDVLDTAGNPEIEEVHNGEIETVRGPNQNPTQQIYKVNVTTGSGELIFNKAIGGSDILGIDDEDIEVVYKFDNDIWQSGVEDVISDPPSVSEEHYDRDIPPGHFDRDIPPGHFDRDIPPGHFDQRLPHEFKNSVARITILAKMSSGEKKKKILRKMKIEEKRIILDNFAETADPLDRSDMDVEKLEKLPIFASITDNELLLGENVISFDYEVNMQESLIEPTVSRKFSESDLETAIGATPASDGCDCWDAGLFSLGPCTSCVVSQPACAGTISACVASLGLTCAATLSCIDSTQSCVDCVICLDTPCS